MCFFVLQLAARAAAGARVTQEDPPDVNGPDSGSAALPSLNQHGIDGTPQIEGNPHFPYLAARGESLDLSRKREGMCKASRLLL
jgi:hypothetical protein